MSTKKGEEYLAGLVILSAVCHYVSVTVLLGNITLEDKLLFQFPR